MITRNSSALLNCYDYAPVFRFSIIVKKKRRDLYHFPQLNITFHRIISVIN